MPAADRLNPGDWVTSLHSSPAQRRPAHPKTKLNTTHALKGKAKDQANVEPFVRFEFKPGIAARIAVEIRAENLRKH